MDEPIAKMTVAQWLDALAAGTPAPGGGSAAAVAGAMAAALAAMVCRATLARASKADGAGSRQQDASLRQVLQEAEALRLELTELATADALAYASVLAAYRLPRNNAAEKAARNQAFQSAMQRATETPLEIAQRLLTLFPLMGAVADEGIASARVDVAVGALLVEAALQGVALTVQTNLSAMIEDTEFRATANSKLEQIMSSAAAQKEQILSHLALTTAN